MSGLDGAQLVFALVSNARVNLHCWNHCAPIAWLVPVALLCAPCPAWLQPPVKQSMPRGLRPGHSTFVFHNSHAYLTCIHGLQLHKRWVPSSCDPQLVCFACNVLCLVLPASPVCAVCVCLCCVAAFRSCSELPSTVERERQRGSDAAWVRGAPS